MTLIIGSGSTWTARVSGRVGSCRVNLTFACCGFYPKCGLLWEEKI